MSNLKRCWLRWAAPLALALSCNGSWAAYECAAVPSGMSIEVTTGDVLLGKLGPLNWARLCNVRAAANGIDAATCKATYASLLAAQAAGKSVRIYSNAAQVGSCTAHPPWEWMAGFYFFSVAE